MKKIITILICIFMICNINVSATAKSEFHTYVYDQDGNSVFGIDVKIRDLNWGDNPEYALTLEDAEKEQVMISSEILDNAKENEQIIIMDLKADNEDNPYPMVESLVVNIDIPEKSKGNESGDRELGKGYRILYFDDSGVEDFSENIVRSNLTRVDFNVNKLGKYVMYFRPISYSVRFYTEKPVYEYEDEDDENPVFVNPECVYAAYESMYNCEVVEFPPIPQKEGYIFTGWKAWRGTQFDYIESQPLVASDYSKYYASWCREDEYEPISITISSNEKIVKGKEDGAKITLRSDYGYFEDISSSFDWDYDDPDIYEDWEKELAQWNEKWHIVGSNEVKIASAERINRYTIELTLSGKSTDIYKSSDIYIEFDSALLKSEPIEYYDRLEFPADTKIKIDSDGVRAKMYRSDNAITLSKQKKSGSGGSSGGGSSAVSVYNVTFDTDGGTDVSKQTVNRNDFVKEPEAPLKEGFVFGGWYSDKDYAVSFDFDTKITKNITLYAKWEVEEKESEKNTENMIVFNVGDTRATIFGDDTEFDVAPIIRDDRSFLPARFVAESLGAEVEWNGETREVIITKNETRIIIVIGSQTAKVNGEEMTLDAPAFIENGRTYTPLRFVAESLGAKVEWNDGEIRIYR